MAQNGKLDKSQTHEYAVFKKTHLTCKATWLKKKERGMEEKIYQANGENRKKGFEVWFTI